MKKVTEIVRRRLTIENKIKTLFKEKYIPKSDYYNFELFNTSV